MKIHVHICMYTYACQQEYCETYNMCFRSHTLLVSPKEEHIKHAQLLEPKEDC